MYCRIAISFKSENEISIIATRLVSMAVKVSSTCIIYWTSGYVQSLVCPCKWQQLYRLQRRGRSVLDHKTKLLTGIDQIMLVRVNVCGGGEFRVVPGQIW